MYADQVKNHLSNTVYTKEGCVASNILTEPLSRAHIANIKYTVTVNLTNKRHCNFASYLVVVMVVILIKS